MACFRLLHDDDDDDDVLCPAYGLAVIGEAIGFHLRVCIQFLSNITMSCSLLLLHFLVNCYYCSWSMDTRCLTTMLA